MRKRKQNRYIVFSFIFLVFGFIFSFSYSQSKKEENLQVNLTDRQYRIENNMRSQLLDIQDRNRKLQKELYEKQSKVRQFEKELSQEEEIYFNLAEDTEKYRMFLGKVKVKGPGVEVVLEDAEYIKSEDVNNYIVHEHHVFKVVNELYIAGASAVAINGQRISHDSYIVCQGPVITVDGNPHPAPFIISAIGDSDVLASAISITGGVRDQIVNDNIVFSLEKKKNIMMEPIFGEVS